MAWDVDVCGGSIRRSRDNMSLEADKALEERGRHLQTWLLGTLQLNSRSLCRQGYRQGFGASERSPTLMPISFP